MTYDGPVRETVPEYEIVCSECDRVSYVRAESPETAEEWFTRRGWHIHGGSAMCRACAYQLWGDDE